MWALTATTQPVGLADANELLRIANELSYRSTPTFAGVHKSAYWAAGYPMLLAPFVWLSRHSGGVIDALHMASLVNAVAGTTTILSTAFLAARWMGPRARNVAAWLIALAPAQIYWTSTAHSETVITALILGVLALTTFVVERPGRERVPRRTWVGLGLLIGFAILVKSSGLVLLAVPWLVLRAKTVSRRVALTATVLVVAGTLVPTVAWTIRNGVEVGVWTPLGTQNATVACMGNNDDATGGWHPTERAAFACYRHSPFVDPEVRKRFPEDFPPGIDYGRLMPADEARWYKTATRKGVSWAVHHPVREIVLFGQKMAEAWGSEWDALPAATNFQRMNFAGWARTPLDAGANLFLWFLELGFVLALVLVPACRRARPILVVAVLLTVMIGAGLAQPHYRHPVIPLMIVIVSGALVEAKDRIRPRRARPENGTLDASPG